MLSTLINWLLFETMIGVAAATAAAYFLVRIISKKASNAYIAAGTIFLLAMCILPSVPRYQFETKTLRDIDNRPWARIIDKIHWGDLVEPATWFNAPVGFFKVAMPYDSVTQHLFRIIIFRYKEEPFAFLIETDCSAKSYRSAYHKTDETSFPLRDIFGEDTGFAYTTNKAEKADVQSMTDIEYEAFCEYEWDKERKLLSKQTL